MEHLVTYITANVEELVADLLPALHEVDGVFRECDPNHLREALQSCVRRFAIYAETRVPAELDEGFRALENLWPPERFFQSALIRILFGVEDLVAIRTQSLYADPEDFIDALRALRSAVREALCAFGDRLQQRFVTWGARSEGRGNGPAGFTMPMSPNPISPTHTPEIEARLPRQRSNITAELPSVRPVGRETELRQLWARLRAVAGREGAGHQLVGIKAPPGHGKSTLVKNFLGHVTRQIGRDPMVLRARAPRLFDLPRWPFAVLLRDAFEAPLGGRNNPAKVRASLEELADELQSRARVDRGSLLGSLPYILRLIGEEEAPDEATGLSSRTMGIRQRRALVTVVEVLALRARLRTGAPLFLVFDDAGEMDRPSWDLLRHVLINVRSAAPVMVLLTYDARFQIPDNVARLPGFNEVTLPQLDMNQGEQLIDTLLKPNKLDEQTRLRLNVGAAGSPLLIMEGVRQLIEEGIIAREDGEWVEVQPLPDGTIADLGTVVARRKQRLDATAIEIVEVVAVCEDTLGGSVLEEVAARRAITREELVDALRKLQRVGLIEVEFKEDGIVAFTRHAMVHDEVYRQMGLERRRAIHEDAGEVFMKLAGAHAFPSLAASHLALAGWPTRALHGLLDGIDRCVEHHNLDGALELCSQALGLVKGLAPNEHDPFLFQILRRREQLHTRLGNLEAQAQDLTRLASINTTEAEQERWVESRQAIQSVLHGDHAKAEERLLVLVKGAEQGTTDWAKGRLTLAINCWQQGQFQQARLWLDEALPAEKVAPGLRARMLHLRGRLSAADGGELPEALHHLFEAWRLQHQLGDVYGESLIVRDVALHFWTVGRLLDAERLMRHAARLLSEASEPRARARALLELGDLLASMGEFDEANGIYAEVLRSVDKQLDRLVHARAIIGQGRILVNRGRFDEAMSLLAQCLKELGRRAVREPVYVDALVALAMNFAMFARGEKLVVGGLRYAGEAKDRATEIGHRKGLVQALVIQVRGLVALGREAEAEAHLKELDAAMQSAIEVEPRLNRLVPEVELARHMVRKARGDEEGAHGALQTAWGELSRQLDLLNGSGKERGFLGNFFQHREIVRAAGRQELLASAGGSSAELSSKA